MVRLLWLLSLAAASAFLVGVAMDLYWLRLAVKLIPVGCMAFWLWSREEPKDTHVWGIFVGLLFSMGGDLFLEISKNLFVVGLVSFLIAHLCYIFAYLSTTRKPVILQALPFLGYGVSFYAFLYGSIQLKFPRLVVPVALYTFVLCCMMWRASALFHAPGIRRSAAWMALFGAMTFAASDSLIALNKFVWPIPGVRYAIIVTYWLGQLGILLSVLRDEPPPQESTTSKRYAYEVDLRLK